MRAFLALVAAILMSGALLLIAVGVHGQLLNLVHSSEPGEQSFGNGFPSQPWPITSTVNAINYDIGGSGIGYNNPGGVNPSCLYASPYRPDTINFKTSTAGPPYQLGCSYPGAAYKYTMNFSGVGPFTITANLADSSPGGSWGVSMDGTSIGTIATPGTGSFTTFQASSLSAPFNATAGNHTLLYTAQGGDAFFNSSGDFLSFSVTQSGSSGVACAIGPNYTGTVPSGATAVGFTTCVVNFDFTNTSSFTYGGHTYTWATLSSWLDCAGAGAGVALFHLSFGNCADVRITTDGGVQVLALDWTAADDVANPGLLTQIQTPNLSSYAWPNGGYFDSTFRLVSLANLAGTSAYLSNTFSVYNDGGTHNWAEFDDNESYANNGSGSGYGEWTTDGSCGGHCVPSAASGASNQTGWAGLTTYSSYAMRITQIPAGQVAFCSYLNETQVTPTGCTTLSFSGGSSDPSVTQKNGFVIQGLRGHSFTGTPANTSTVTTYWKNVVVFSCAAWATTPCNSASLDTGTP